MDNPLAIEEYIIPFVLAVLISIILTLLVRRIALRLQIVDNPEVSPDRKVQSRSVPLLGGLAIYFTVAIVILYYTLFTDRVLGGYMEPKFIAGILIAGGLLMMGGFLDDKRSLGPAKQIIWPVLATLVIIASGIGVQYITNPFGGVFSLDIIQLELFSINSTPYFLVLLADLFAFVWLMGMMYTTKFLDGLDGLVSGITTLGALILFFFSINKEVAQPETALLAVILAGASLGFLIFNWHPAKIYLGEGGSLFTGFMLGVLAIISGAKIATAMLIMGIPILDVIWVIIRRLFFEKRSPFSGADKKHLHFRLLDIGLSHRQTVIFLYGITFIFGCTALFLGSRDKLATLAVMLLIMILLGSFVVVRYRHSANK